MEPLFIKETIEKVLELLSANARYGGSFPLSGAAGHDGNADELAYGNPAEPAEGRNSSELAEGGEILRHVVETDEPHLLIGEDGRTLLALNHLVKKICEAECARRKLEPVNFIVDVNDYQKKRIQDIRNKAQIMAERARFFKSNVELIPMNPYERMIVHSFFSDVSDIETESTGAGRDRRVVIKYVAGV